MHVQVQCEATSNSGAPISARFEAECRFVKDQPMNPELKERERNHSQIQDGPEEDEGHAIQRALLPPTSLIAQGFDVSYRLFSFADVGGDFLDYFELPSGCLGLYLGDVVGKGLAAAMYAALAQGTLRGIHKNGQRPVDVLELFNRRLRVRAVSRRYCAAQYAVYDPARLELRFSNAGLPLPLHYSASDCRALGAGGLPSGLFDNVRYEEHCTQLAPGDVVVFATDGLHEMTDSRGEFYGASRVTQLRRGRGLISAEEVLEGLFADMGEFAAGRPHEDDVTAVALVVPPR
jgi:phosphoserine phosphatase RsbU/P